MIMSSAGWALTARRMFFPAQNSVFFLDNLPVWSDESIVLKDESNLCGSIYVLLH